MLKFSTHFDCYGENIDFILKQPPIKKKVEKLASGQVLPKTFIEHK